MQILKRLIDYKILDSKQSNQKEQERPNPPYKGMPVITLHSITMTITTCNNVPLTVKIAP